MKKLVYLLVGIFLMSSIIQLVVPVASATSSTYSGRLKGEQLGFAYADESGKRLLGFRSNNPKRFVQAYYAPGKALNVKYVKHQTRTEESNGRQTQWNFDQDEGDLFNIVKGKIPGNESVLLAEKNAFQGHEFLKYKPVSKGSLSKSIVSNIEKAKKRKVATQALIGQASGEVEIALVVFERIKGKAPLASLVLSTKSGLFFEDFIGNDNEMSTWRVDDGGTITAEMFKILFVSKSKAGYSFGFEWGGAEGYALKVLQQKGKLFRTVLEDSRYAAPV
ncbi:hypothetical protein [Cohnella abietis]|uniref:Uncharacterized protein n=1 Tax=Cohnella abietis TaxID=2507935 RepID=A0A3T1CZQ5_9BACL|nr:hypothetical protein [Cohnella abietis]BBI31249.1 hypothetical protein KCTCHS21_06480 [Cohnella abietis]